MSKRCFVCGNLAPYCICRRAALAAHVARLESFEDEVCDHDGFCFDCGHCSQCCENDIERLEDVIRATLEYIERGDEDDTTALEKVLAALRVALEEAEG